MVNSFASFHSFYPSNLISWSEDKDRLLVVKSLVCIIVCGLVKNLVVLYYYPVLRDKNWDRKTDIIVKCMSLEHRDVH